MPRVDSPRRTVLTVSEVGNYLRIHPSTIYRMLKKHELSAPRGRQRLALHGEALDEWVRENSTTQGWTSLRVKSDGF